MNEEWHKWAKEKGYRISFGTSSMVETPKKFLEGLKSKKMVDELLYQEYLSGFKYLKGIDVTSMKTLVLVAIPKTAYILKYKYKGQSGSVIFPPTYVRYRQTFKRILTEARSAFGKTKHHLELIDAPLKTLAILTGLAKYGRNNIAYTPEMGSYFQLVGLITDMVLEPENPKKNVPVRRNLLPDCKNCSACLKSCTAEAIKEDQILLHAEKCYTYFSESARELPEHILPPSPECIIGCLSCQNVCPANIGKLTYQNTPFSLSEKETSFITHHFDKESSIWQQIVRKFSQLKLTELSEIFARNFKRHIKLSFEVK